MSTIDLVPRRERWTVSATKMYGWLTGVAFSLFGGLMCAVPSGAVLGGLLAVTIGVFLCLTFSISMSASALSHRWTFSLLVLGLALLVFGRVVAPVEPIVQSFRENLTLVRKPTLLGVIGIPLMLFGMELVQLAVPWVRRSAPLSLVRSVVAMALLIAASLGLIIGLGLITTNPSIRVQPWTFWIAVPLAFALGVGLRDHWRCRAWIAVMVLTAVAQPLAWQLLVRAPL